MSFKKALGKASKVVTADDTVTMVSDFLRKYDLDPDEVRVDSTEDDFVAWSFGKGSALINIRLHEDAGRQLLRVYSPILRIPSKNVLPLYRRCMELNFFICSCAFSVLEDVIILTTERPIEALDAEELEHLTEVVMHIADEFDDRLAEEFGATKLGLE